MSQQTPEDLRKAELEFYQRDAVNKLYLLAEMIPDQSTAALFVAQASAPLARLNRRFQMNGGKVVKVARRTREQLTRR